MYISLYPAKQLEKAKEMMLWLGMFMLSGGFAALLNELVIQDDTRWYWAGAALLIAMTGIVLVGIGTNRIHLKDAYFAITPARISYRLHLYSRERIIDWQQIAGIQVSDRYILFDLTSGRQILLRLGSIQSHNTASQVAIGLQAAALEHNLTVNGVKFNTHRAAS